MTHRIGFVSQYRIVASIAMTSEGETKNPIHARTGHGVGSSAKPHTVPLRNSVMRGNTASPIR